MGSVQSQLRDDVNDRLNDKSGNKKQVKKASSHTPKTSIDSTILDGTIETKSKTEFQKLDKQLDFNSYKSIEDVKYCIEYHSWANHIGGNLNTKSRMHKPHHTVKTTPHLERSLILPYLKKATKLPIVNISDSLPIKRRISTGSIKVHRAVENMDFENMIRVISIVLHQHIVKGSNLSWKIAPQYLIFDDSVMRFRGFIYDEVPSPEQVHEFFSYIHHTAQLECDCVVSSLLYIERLLTETAGQLRMCPKNWRSIILSGMILASKVWDDLSMWSSDFARVGHLTVKRINQLEVAVLSALGYDVCIDSSVFARYFFQLRHWCLHFEAVQSTLKKEQGRSKANQIKLSDKEIRESRSRSLPFKLDLPQSTVKFTRTLSRTEFSSTYKGLFPCMEELVYGELTKAGGCKHCLKDLKQHELKSQICYNIRKNLGSPNIRRNLKIVEGDVSKNYVTMPKNILGVGVSGVVQVVHHKITGKEYAMKMLQIDRLKNFRKREELRNEIDVLATLNHPNIISLLEIYESLEKDSVSLIMELCTGGELFTRLSNHGRYDEQACSKITKKMLLAVEHCHENSICHRDLKLENWVFLDDSEDAELKLIDFGLSRRFRKNEIMTVPVGTPYIVAPEVLDCEYTNLCDLWSIGVLVYMLLIGMAPFPGDDDYQILEAIKRGVWSWPQQIFISIEAKDFVEMLLKSEKSNRLSASEALQHSWIAKFE